MKKVLFYLFIFGFFLTGCITEIPISEEVVTSPQPTELSNNSFQESQSGNSFLNPNQTHSDPNQLNNPHPIQGFSPNDSGINPPGEIHPSDGAQPNQPPLPSQNEIIYDENHPRHKYMGGELVQYSAQSGDTVKALAARFNTTEKEIFDSNPNIPRDVTTLPQGMPMNIPIYFRANWGTSFEMIPDSLFVYSPESIGFSARAYTDRSKGWFKYFTIYTADKNRRGGEIVDYIAENYSINPRLLLAIIEFQTHALSSPYQPDGINQNYVLGFRRRNYESLSAQLNQLANFLNNAYYRYREGDLIGFDLQDGSKYVIDPWQNASTAALQYYFSTILSADQFRFTVGPDGFSKLYKQLFGDFPNQLQIHANIPGSLQQPKFQLPFEEDRNWSFTGGPHAAWGENEPLAAVDFAPPSSHSGCVYSGEWVLTPAEGTIVRTDKGLAILDLDDDHDERTGWDILFLHLLTPSIPPVGTHLKAGDRIGHPSCDGGTATGTHVHLARKFNGEWIDAGGSVPLNFDGWTVQNGSEPYLGTLKRYSSTVIACTCSDYKSQIHVGPPVVPTPTATMNPKSK